MARRKLTLKQRRFVLALLGTAKGNQAEAARLAGYRGGRRQLAVQGSANMKNETINRMIDDAIDGMGRHALARLTEGLDATKTRSFVTRTGTIVKGEAEIDHGVRLRSIQLWDRLRQKRPRGLEDDAIHHDQDFVETNKEVAEGVGQPAAAKDIAQADDVLAQMKALNERARELAGKAENAGDYRTALMAIRELTRLLELTAKLTGELDDRAQRNELHVHLTADRALAVAKTYLERHGAALASSVDLAGAEQGLNPVEQAQQLDGDPAAVLQIKEEGNPNETENQQS